MPVYGDLQPTETRNLMTMSVVVFNQRQFSPSPYRVCLHDLPSERSCQVTAVSGSGWRRRRHQRSAARREISLNLRVGEVLDARFDAGEAIPSSCSGKTITFNPVASYGQVARPMFRWYRTGTARPGDGPPAAVRRATSPSVAPI